MSLFPSQCNTIYIIFFLPFSLTTSFGLTWPSSGVDHYAKLSHCINNYFGYTVLFCFFSDTHYHCLYKKIVYNFILKNAIKISFHKIFRLKTFFLNCPFLGCRPLVICAYSYVCCSCFPFTSLVVFILAPGGPVLPYCVWSYLV
jgi:hypothetical protein